MRDFLETAASGQGGLIPAASLKQLGVSPQMVQALVGRGELVRIRYGVYVSGERWTAAKASERYRLFVLATHFLGRRPVVVSHESAAILHELPTIGAWPKTVHVLDAGASGGSNARFTTRHRAAFASASDTVQIGAITVTSLARTLVDVAMNAPFLVAVTMIDHALRTERERELAAEKQGIRGPSALTKVDLYAELRPGLSLALRAKAERAIGFATDLSANPGETLSRVRMLELGFEVPELQVCFPDVGGHDYWVDYYWRSIRKIGEFDGMHKYTRGAVLGDRDPAEVLVAEKMREDALRHDPGCDSFDRWDWNTAISPSRFYAFLVQHGMPRAR